MLEFFLGSDHGISKFGECRDKISELFYDSGKYKRWNTRNDHKPPTKSQLDRLKWWSRELGETLFNDLTFETAKDVLTEWENRRPDLSDKWRVHQWKAEAQEEIFRILKERIWEECDDADLPRPCEDTLRLCWDLVGLGGERKVCGRDEHEVGQIDRRIGTQGSRVLRSFVSGYFRKKDQARSEMRSTQCILRRWAGR